MGVFVICIIIISLVLVLVGIIAFYVTFIKVSKNVREFSQAAFGTPSLAQGAQQLRNDYAITPKSVSGMTQLLLPKITNDFPDFNYDEMKERANNVLTSYLLSINDQTANRLQDGNEEIQNQLENHLRMLDMKDLHEHFEQIRLHQTEIHQYRQFQGRQIITFQTAFECYHYVTDRNNAVIKGSKDMKYQTKYNVDMVYIQDRNLMQNEYDTALGVNCPNCGAPVSSLSAKFCEYCGTGIIEFNIRAWSFCNVEEIN